MDFDKTETNNRGLGEYISPLPQYTFKGCSPNMRQAQPV